MPLLSGTGFPWNDSILRTGSLMVTEPLAEVHDVRQAQLPDLEPGMPRQARSLQPMAPTKAIGLSGPRWVVLATATAIIALVSGCGGSDPTIEVGSGGQATTTSSPADRPAPGCEAEPAADAGSGSAILGEATPEGYEVIDQKAHTVPLGGTASFPVAFEGTSAALMWILPGGDGISATMEGAEFSREDVLGAPAVVAAITSPHDGDLVVRNDTGQAEDIAVIVFGLTGRRLTIDASPSEVTPNGEVAVRFASVRRPLPTPRARSSGGTGRS